MYAIAIGYSFVRIWSIVEPWRYSILLKSPRKAIPQFFFYSTAFLPRFFSMFQTYMECVSVATLRAHKITTWVE